MERMPWPRRASFRSRLDSPPSEPSMLRIALTLSFDLIVGLTIFSLPAIVIPSELALMTEYAAPIVSGVTAAFTAAGMVCPLVGYSVDVLGTNMPHKIFSAVMMTGGCALAIFAVHMRDAEHESIPLPSAPPSPPALPPGIPAMPPPPGSPMPPSSPPPPSTGTSLPLVLYVLGMLMILVPAIAVAGTVYSSITGQFIAARPKNASIISGIAALYILVGGTAGTYTAGRFFPIGYGHHEFYWMLLGVLLVGDVVMLCVDTNPKKPPAAPSLSGDACAPLDVDGCGSQPAPPSSTTTNNEPLLVSSEVRQSRVGTFWQQSRAALYQYICGKEYRAFRLVVIAQMCFRAGGQIGNIDGLFLCQDIFKHPGTSGQLLLGEISLASSIGSLAVALPAGMLADRFGMIPCVVVSTILMGGITAATPFLPDATWGTLILPLNGVAQQLYGVVDFALCVATMPDPSRRARDVGMFNAAGALGPFLISSFNGAVFTAVGGTPTAGSERPTYPQRAYIYIYVPTAILVTLSSVLVCAAANGVKKERNAKARVTESGASDASDSPEARRDPATPMAAP